MPLSRRVNKHIDGIKRSIKHTMKIYLVMFCYRKFQKLVEALPENKTLTILNLESNFLSGELIVEIMKAINKNQTVVELRVANQVRGQRFLWQQFTY